MSIRPAEKPKVYDAQFNARLQRLERMVGQDSGGSSGDALPSYDDSDIGKVLTVGSEYETTGEAIQMQSVTLVDSVGTLDAQKIDASKWTDGQLVSVVFNGTRYVLELSDIEGSISCGNEHFHLYYNSNTGVMTIEAIGAESPVTVSAQYLTEHANADWAEPSGGSGQSALWDFELTITQSYDEALDDYVYSSSLSVAEYIAIKEAVGERGIVWGKCLLHIIDINGITNNHICEYSDKRAGISVIGYKVVEDDIYDPSGYTGINVYNVDENGVIIIGYTLTADLSTGVVRWTQLSD